MKKILIAIALMALPFLGGVQGNPLVNTFTLIPQVQPVSPQIGQIYYNTSDNFIYYYDGGSWVPWGFTTGGLNQTDIDTFAELDAIVADESLVNTDDAQTLTNKTIDGGTNTITGVDVLATTDQSIPALTIRDIDLGGNTGATSLVISEGVNSLFQINGDGTANFQQSSPTVADDAYGVGWNTDFKVPTKNALYDKIETIGVGHLSADAVNVLDGASETAFEHPNGDGLSIQAGQIRIEDGSFITLRTGGAGNATFTQSTSTNSFSGGAVTSDRSIAQIDATGNTSLTTREYVLDAVSGGGDDVSTFSEKTGDLVGTDRLVGLSGVTDFNETISAIPLSIFNNDSGFVEGDENTRTNVIAITKIYGQTQADFDTDGAGPADELIVITDAAPALIDTGTAVDMSGFTVIDDSAVDTATFTLTNLTEGGYAEITILEATEPAVTGATQLPNTTAFVAATEMLLVIKAVYKTGGVEARYYFVEL